MTKTVILVVVVDDDFVEDATSILEEYVGYLEDERGVEKATVFVERGLSDETLSRKSVEGGGAKANQP